MKPTNLQIFISIFAFVLLIISCKNDVNDRIINTDLDETNISSKEEGQAFIEGDVSKPNVLQIALNSPDHTILVAAVQAADLENVLVNAGPLMVFAPTNEAFGDLPEGTFDNLLKPENKEKLASILKHHVTAGNYEIDFLKNFKKLGQADDTNVTIEVRGEDVFVGGAKILGSLKAGNGIVHIVDKVILPESN